MYEAMAFRLSPVSREIARMDFLPFWANMISIFSIWLIAFLPPGCHVKHNRWLTFTIAKGLNVARFQVSVYRGPRRRPR